MWEGSCLCVLDLCVSAAVAQSSAGLYRFLAALDPLLCFVPSHYTARLSLSASAAEDVKMCLKASGVTLKIANTGAGKDIFDLT